MSPRRVTKDDGSLVGFVGVHAWYMAAELLRQEGVDFDLVYQHMLTDTNRYGLPRGHRGPMIHFNRGKTLNVATYNTVTDTLTVLPRPDHLCGVEIAIIEGAQA